MIFPLTWTQNYDTISITMTTHQLGARLKRARVKRDLTPAALARQAGLSTVYVRKIEAGERLPSLSVLERLAQILGVGLARLLK